jgi:DNA-binding HxlR family transcriptional regulator
MERHRIFEALSSRVRLHIIEEMRKGEARPHELEKKLEITRSGLERHLKILLNVGFIKKIVYLEEGKPRLKYQLSPTVEEFLQSLDKSVELFRKVSEEKSREEKSRVLKLEIRSVEETLKKIEDFRSSGSLSEQEYERLKSEYQQKLSGFVSELLDVI